jgi:hypothetical protein
MEERILFDVVVPNYYEVPRWLRVSVELSRRSFMLHYQKVGRISDRVDLRPRISVFPPRFEGTARWIVCSSGCDITPLMLALRNLAASGKNYERIASEPSYQNGVEVDWK